MRIHISSSNSPEYSRNLNTGASIGTTHKTVKAKQIIYHDFVYPLHLILPVISVTASIKNNKIVLLKTSNTSTQTKSF